jgi:hypothetical protein
VASYVDPFMSFKLDLLLYIAMLNLFGQQLLPVLNLVQVQANCCPILLAYQCPTLTHTDSIAKIIELEEKSGYVQPLLLRKF